MRICCALIVLFLTAACSSESSCEQNTESMLQVDMYDYESGETIQADGFTLYGAGRSDSLLYEQENNLGTFYLPLDPARNKVQFFLNISEQWDTLTVQYRPELYFISKACGYTYTYKMDTAWYTGELIDSLSVSKKDIDPSYVQNLRLYY